jgi:tetratricopeptide (TPR) repeat protein
VGRWRAWPRNGPAQSLAYQQRFDEQPRSITQDHQQTAYDYADRGKTYLQLERYEDAIADFTRVIELLPHPTATLDPLQLTGERGNRLPLPDLGYRQQAYFERGLAYDRFGRMDEALAGLTHAIDIGSDTPNSGHYLGRAETYFKLERYELALADLTRSIQLDPLNVHAHITLAMVYQDLGRHQQALAEYTRAIDLDPGAWRAWLNRGAALILLGRADEGLQTPGSGDPVEPGLCRAVPRDGYRAW